MVLWKIREKFQENIRGSILFFILLAKKHSPKDVFFAIFANILEHLRATASEIQEGSLNSYFCYRSSHSQ